MMKTIISIFACFGNISSLINLNVVEQEAYYLIRCICINEKGYTIFNILYFHIFEL